MPFKRRSQKLNNSILISLQGGADCVTFLPGRGGCPQDRWGDSLSWLCLHAPNLLRDGVTRLEGRIECAWRKASGGKCIGLVSQPTRHSERSEESREFRMQQTQILSGSFEPSSQDDRGKHNELVSLLTRHSEPFLLDFQVCSVILSLNIYPSEESRQISLDCFTTFAMTVIRHSEGVFYPTYQLVLTLPIEVHLPLRRVSLLMLRGFFAPLCSALNDKTVTNFSTLQLFNFEEGGAPCLA